MPKVTMSNANAVKIEPAVVEETEQQREEEIVAEMNAAIGADDEEELTLESADPNTPLWTDGPLVKEVLAWKEKHGDIYITNVTYEDHVVWRTLKRPEYRYMVKEIETAITSGKMTQTEANLYQEELICEICTLAPQMSRKDFDGELAGLPSILSQQILESSGFTTIEVRRL